MTDQLQAATTGVPARPLAAAVPLKPVALTTLIFGAFLPMLSFFVINVALPAIGSDLRATSGELQLVVGSYGIAVATLLVVGGRLGDTFGRKRLFLIGLIGFTVMSLICAIAPSIGVLLVARVVQGAAGAAVTPQVLATITSVLTGEHRARAMALYGVAGGAAAAFGQILGGVLVEANVFDLGWRAVFLVNVPVGAVGVAAAIRLVPETKADKAQRVDLVGAALLAVTLVLLLLPLTEGRPLGWPLWTWLCLAATIPAVLTLGAHQHRSERSGRSPLIPPTVLRLRAMRTGLLLAVAFFTTFGGFMFVFALATQGEAHMSPLEGGLSLLPMAVGFLITSIYGPRLQVRYGAGLIVRGWIIQGVGYAVLAVVALTLWPDVNPLKLAVPMLIAGFGSGLVMVPLMGVVLGQVPPAQAGMGSGILLTTQQTCLALGAATVGTAYLSMAGTSWGQGGALAAVALTITVISLLMTPVTHQLRSSGKGA
ncbi:EmrB/QacA subfamily drug resistance transporter [Kribbella aluminosa]|uniref:EmrB/QacA subfamily drug resistance transporter n=1 Tax=Kribbella aluminosa TaxID=416017 RepID=A0ABS4UV38_9ACTN|nr:MFS transporter [Kribbella aluminosa]MBP2355510.1 EmrB/QacA subfamily drug resistance transporter [Kribbella aluminosa]